MSPTPDSDSHSPQQAIDTAVRRQQGPSEPEQDLWSGGYSAKTMLGTWLLSIVATIGIIAALLIFPVPEAWKLDGRTLWTIVLGIIVAWWLTIIGVYAYRRVATHYQLTTQRFIHTNGILVRTTDRIDVIDIDDVTFSQGLVQRALGIGTIVLTSSDATHPNLTLRGIDSVDKVSGMIDDTRRKERRKRSLHIESV